MNFSPIKLFPSSNQTFTPYSFQHIFITYDHGLIDLKDNFTDMIGIHSTMRFNNFG